MKGTFHSHIFGHKVTKTFPNYATKLQKYSPKACILDLFRPYPILFMTIFI